MSRIEILLKGRICCLCKTGWCISNIAMVKVVTYWTGQARPWSGAAEMLKFLNFINKTCIHKFH